MKFKFLKSGTPYGFGYLAGSAGDLSGWYKKQSADKELKKAADELLSEMKENNVIEKV